MMMMGDDPEIQKQQLKKEVCFFALRMRREREEDGCADAAATAVAAAPCSENS